MKSAPSLREATLADADLIFEWRNRAEIVALGTAQRAVTAGEHAEWFSRAVASPDTILFVIEDDGEPVGQVRLDREDDGWVVSIYLLSEHTGRGLGVEALRLACQQALARASDLDIVAYVREENEHSQKAFTRAGFLPRGAAPAGHLAFHYRGERA